MQNFKYRLHESYRKIQRQLDLRQNYSHRKLFLLLFSVAVVILYIGPSFLRWLFIKPNELIKDATLRCMDDRLTPFYSQNNDFNANIKHNPIYQFELNTIPYVGNGIFGIEIQEDAHLSIKEGRALVLPVNFHPIVSLATKKQGSVMGFRESTVVEYTSGLVHRFQCFDNGVVASYTYYAHRRMPSVFVQEIQITNTKNQLIDVELVMARLSDWPTAVMQNLKLQHGSTILEYQVVTGLVETINNQVRAVSIVARILPKYLTLKKRGVTKLELLLTIYYSSPIDRAAYATQKDIVEKNAIDAMKKALQEAEHDEANRGSVYYNFRRQHISVWQSIWETGFEISQSKAENVLNGDRINATMYAVLSQVRSYEFEESIALQRKQDIAKSLTYAEGCFDSYHTLQAENLWKEMRSLEEFNNLMALWLLTLEKQGCHNLIKAGASGVVQAMVLSFGGFRFSNQHLEFNIHPKFLHRDYLFRRLNYGNLTHLNVSVSVGEDNKAVMSVALDRSDKTYYACDAGCLDDPVQLRASRIFFPVKLTEPVTSILYITYDKQHMEDLRHAIHVKEVAEAPAHEHHVIALHRHGHHLGGLPTLFWVSVCVIIVVFHVFLCKLIVKEYCEPPDKMRYRYSKP